MKQKTIYWGAAALIIGVMMALPAGAFPRKPTSTARFINIETPFRCSVKKAGDLDIATTLALRPQDFTLKPFDQMDSLPRYEVNGLSFSDEPIDEALQKLVDEANITVYAEDGFYPAMDAEDVYGELNQVTEELAEAGKVFYRYDGVRKELYLSRKARFELQLPESRMVMLAMLDALRGAGILDLRPDWKNNTILMSLSRTDKQKVEDLITYIRDDGYILLADTQVFMARPKHRHANWQKAVRRYGAGRIYAANNGLSGKILVMNNQIPAHLFLQAVETEFDIHPLTQGIALVPNGWKMRFNLGQCAPRQTDLTALSVLLSAHIQSPDKVETDLTLNAGGDEISSFNSVAAIDNELVVVGIPVPRQSGHNELMATVKLRLIRLVKDN